MPSPWPPNLVLPGRCSRIGCNHPGIHQLTYSMPVKPDHNGTDSLEISLQVCAEHRSRVEQESASNPRLTWKPPNA